MEPTEKPKPSRIAAARARAAAAKRVLAVGAVCAFGGALLLARVSHPGASSGSSSKATGSSAASTASSHRSSDSGDLLDDFDSGGSSIGQAPSGSYPQVQTSSS
jgi:hypothetical protein